MLLPCKGIHFTWSKSENAVKENTNKESIELEVRNPIESLWLTLYLAL